MGATESPVPESPSLMRRRGPFLAPIWLLVLVAGTVLIAGFVYWRSMTTTTIVVIRHAEKEVNSISDAPLAPEGELRAARLAQMFGDASKFGRVEKIYVTDTRRTQQTATALAQRLSLVPEVVSARTGSADLARRVLRENRGGRALVIGHSNTVPELVSSLAHVEEVPAMSDEEFDTLYVITVPSVGRASVLRMKY
jgi:broad specificity phosphatase PhoE